MVIMTKRRLVTGAGSYRLAGINILVPNKSSRLRQMNILAIICIVDD
jgi:hypothetical protein